MAVRETQFGRKLGAINAENKKELEDLNEKLELELNSIEAEIKQCVDRDLPVVTIGDLRWLVHPTRNINKRLISDTLHHLTEDGFDIPAILKYQDLRVKLEKRRNDEEFKEDAEKYDCASDTEEDEPMRDEVYTSTSWGKEWMTVLKSQMDWETCIRGRKQLKILKSTLREAALQRGERLSSLSTSQYGIMMLEEDCIEETNLIHRNQELTLKMRQAERLAQFLARNPPSDLLWSQPGCNFYLIFEGYVGPEDVVAHVYIIGRKHPIGFCSGTDFGDRLKGKLLWYFQFKPTLREQRFKLKSLWLSILKTWRSIEASRCEPYFLRPVQSKDIFPMKYLVAMMLKRDQPLSMAFGSFELILFPFSRFTPLLDDAEPSFRDFYARNLENNKSSVILAFVIRREADRSIQRASSDRFVDYPFKLVAAAEQVDPTTAESDSDVVDSDLSDHVPLLRVRKQRISVRQSLKEHDTKQKDGLDDYVPLETYKTPEPEGDESYGALNRWPATARECAKFQDDSGTSGLGQSHSGKLEEMSDVIVKMEE